MINRLKILNTDYNTNKSRKCQFDGNFIIMLNAKTCCSYSFLFSRMKVGRFIFHLYTYIWYFKKYHIYITPFKKIPYFEWIETEMYTNND